MANLAIPSVEATVLCYDELIGRYFYSTVAELDAVLSELNRIIFRSGDASLNDFYQMLDLPPVRVADELEWRSQEVYFRLAGHLSSDNRPAISVGFSPDPKPTPGEIVF